MESAKKRRILAYLSIFFVVVLWGVSPVIGKYLLTSYSPGVSRIFTTVFSTATLSIVANKQLKNINKSYILFSLPIGVCFAIALLLEKVGLNYTTPVKNNFFGNATVVITPITFAIFSRKLPGISKVIAAIVWIVGFFIIGFGDTLSGGLPSFELGDFLSLLSCVFYAIPTTAIAAFAKDKNPLLLTFLQFAFSIPVCVIYTFFEPVVFSFNLFSILFLVLFTALINGVGWLLRNFAVQVLDPGFVAIVLSFSTIISLVISIITGMDAFSWSLVIGGIICVASAIISGLPPKKLGDFEEKSEYAEK